MKRFLDSASSVMGDYLALCRIMRSAFLPPPAEVKSWLGGFIAATQGGGVLDRAQEHKSTNGSVEKMPVSLAGRLASRFRYTGGGGEGGLILAGKAWPSRSPVSG